MVLLAWAVAIAGLGLLFTSVRIALRARQHEHIPLTGRLDPMPPHAEWTYTAGLLLTMSSGLLNSRDVAPWNIVLFFAAVIAAALGFSLHNRRIDRLNATGSEGDEP
ncbi:hypothetical protein FB468_2691 [Leucobacter komagatae]|uniref:Uncharacterized protein n=1 Tax=Leucobacter komagatae TaxID=55969 RepID=A0A542Y956_9MICO|nr:hypothetical protein [Leucobacter komagatae]TQL44630.1 hypothetical protein FB468_2691 [Leucobacter komagatae]